MNNVQNAKVVRVGFIARRLLHNGYPIVDIKPHRTNPDRTVFVFEKTENLLREIKSIELEHELSQLQ